MAEVGTQNSVTVKIEPEEHYKATDLVHPFHHIASVEGSKGVEGIPGKVEGGEIAGAVAQQQQSATVVPAAVNKARRLAAWKRSSRDSKNGFLYTRAGRQKYGINGDPPLVRPLNRSKLRLLLTSLMQQQKWHQACGVLGVLLGIPYNNPRLKFVEGCRADFAAAMEVLRQVGDVESNRIRIRRLFRILALQQPNPRTRGRVQLELALYLMSTGDREAAYDELRPIVDGKLYCEDPEANLTHGLNSYHLWYEKAVDEISRQTIAEPGNQIDKKEFSSVEGVDESYAPESVGQMRGQWGGARGSFLYGDSQRFGGQQGRENLQGDGSGNMIWQSSQRSIYEETDDQGFVKTGEEFWQNVIVPSSSLELDQRLFPIQIPKGLVEEKHYLVPMIDSRIRDLHAAGVKHLKQALASAPDMLPALLPLVQLLLAVHDIKGAVDEIDKCSSALKQHFIPPSIKVALLECLDQKDPARLASCHLDVLMRNPSSLSSLKGLINLHASGDLETKVLLKCICLHLDVDAGSVDTWQRLASCLLEIRNKLQRFSSEDGDINVVEGRILSPEQLVPEAVLGLSQDDLRHLWSGRCQWWLVKHFNKLTQHKQNLDGDRWLLAYKAACAAHIFGPKELFVEEVCKALVGEEDEEVVKFVELHCERSLMLFVEQ